MNSLSIFSSIVGNFQGLCTQRRQNEGQQLIANAQLNLSQRTEAPDHCNQQLLDEIARHRENALALRQSEQQYRFIFAECPQPQWIFDLRSLKILAVNRAALSLFGYTLEEFMPLSAGRLLQPEAVRPFLGDVARPCPKAQSRGRWLLSAKAGDLIEADISAVDLNFDGCPARLLAVTPVIERVCPHPEPPRAIIQVVTEVPKPQPLTEPPQVEAVSEVSCKTAPAVDRTMPVMERQPKVAVLKAPERIPSPEASRRVAFAPESISLPVRNSTPAKPAPPALGLADLPRTAAAQPPEVKHPQATPVAPKPPPRRSASGKETILLVEPEGKARGLARFILSRQGYRVIETDCSSTVLALWESESTSVDVLLTDISLPEGMSGATLADQLRETKPELKVVYTSAPTETESEDALIEQNIVPKPYSADKLLEAVKNCLTREEEVSCAVA